MGLDRDYQQFEKQVHLFFDNELQDCDCQNLMQKVNDDPRCQNIYNKEKHFRDFIKTNIKRPSVSSSLLTNIRSCIRVED